MSGVQAAPTKNSVPVAAAKTPQPAFFVEPKAHQIWVRAAKLYGSLNSLQIAWKNRSIEPPMSALSKRGSVVTNSTILIDYQGFLKKLRFEMQQNGVQSQVVIDEKTMSLANSAGFGDMQSQISLVTEVVPDAIKRKGTKIYVKPLDSQSGGADGMIYSALNDATSEDVETLFRWLFNADSLNENSVRNQIKGGYFSSLRAIVLPSQLFQEQLCDLVRVTTLDDDLVPDKGSYLVQKTYWFSQKDGRLLRIQGRAQLGSGAASTSDLEVTKQDLAPQLSAQTWKFVPPTYATTPNKSAF